jgi:hypothetical protein
MVELAGTAAAILSSGGGLASFDELQHAATRLNCIGILRSPSRGW